MENEEKVVTSSSKSQSSNWGLYFLILGCSAVFVAMLVSAYLDHN